MFYATQLFFGYSLTMSDYKVIDFNSWKRKEVFNFFKDYQDPYFNITVDIDVSGLWKFCKEQKKSFFLSSLFVACKAANDIEDFRTRKSDNEIRKYDLIHPGCTVLKDDDTFAFGYFSMKEKLEDFITFGQKEIDRVKDLKDMGADDYQLDIIYFSALPWMSFTSFKNARMDNASNGIPKIVFGKVYSSNGEQYKMPISIEVHHSFLDGYHVGQYVTILEEIMNSDFEDSE